MEKEKILEASRKDNQNKDFADIETTNKAETLAAIGIVILSSIYFVMEIIIKGTTNYGWYSIIALYNAMLYGYKAVKDKKKLHIFNGVIWGFVAILLITAYIKDMFVTSNIQ